MRSPVEVLLAVAHIGGRLGIAGDKLRMLLPVDCPPELKEAIRRHKAELLDWLARPPCSRWGTAPPTDLPLNAVMPRPTPADRERVIAYLLRQGCDRPGLLTAWLVRRENVYYEGPGKKWDCSLLAYAAARDAACWQFRQSESDLWQMLANFGEGVEGHR